MGEYIFKNNKDVTKKWYDDYFSTHMMDVVAEIGDRILFMREGKVVQEIKNNGNLENVTLTLLRMHRR